MKKRPLKVINAKYPLYIASAVLFLLTSGCNGTYSHEVEPIAKELYQKAAVETATVQRGDINPQLVFSLNQNAYKYYSYRVDEENLEFEALNVSAGDYVKAGTVMVSFKSEKLKKQVDEERKKLEQNQLLLNHTRNLRQIVAETDTSKMTSDEVKKLEKKIKGYDDTITMLEDDIKLKTVELEEKQRELDKCTIKARESGTITYVNKLLVNGQVAYDADLITMASGDLIFYTDVNDDFTFEIGEVYEASSPTMQLSLKAYDIVEESSKTTVYFKPVDEDILYIEGEKFTITIEKDSLHDVIFVDEKTVDQLDDGRYFVQVVNEDGFKEVRFIEIDCFVDGKAVITSGLSEGEEVAK